MNANTTKTVVTAIWATVIIVFLSLFSEKVKIDLNAPFLHLNLSGSNANETAAGITGKGLKAGKDIIADDKAGAPINIENAEAKGSIKLSKEAPSGEHSPPKR